ncbi:hypothetical protein ACHQM5_007059 [Ranunculus cassubicifolius]
MVGILVCIIFLFVGVGFLLLVHFCVGEGGGYFRWAFYTGGGVVQRRTNICYNIPREHIDLEKLTCYDMKADDSGSSPKDCAVCVENLKVGDRCRSLPRCKHSFHLQCIDLWLLKTPICPICRSSAHSWKTCVVSGEGASDEPNQVADGIELGSNLDPSSSSPSSSSSNSVV